MTPDTIHGCRITTRLMILLVVLLLIVILPASGNDGGREDPGPDSAIGGEIHSIVGSLPPLFVPNEGQADEEVLFLCKGPGYTLFFTRDRVVTSLLYDDEGVMRRHAVIQRFAGSNPEPVVEGMAPLGTRVSYFTGPEPDWHTGITPFGGIISREIYPGIDAIYQGLDGTIKREFVIHPGADPYRIRMVYEGADRVRVSGDGYLVIEAGSGEIRESPPVCYQDIKGNHVGIPCRFDQGDDGSISFLVGWYDRSLPLVIDPAITYCGYIGGSSQDLGRGIAVDGAGNVYIVGQANSDEITFPVKAGPDLTHNGGTADVFIAKVNASGTDLSYCGYIGGDNADFAGDIAIDGAGNVYVVGTTQSSETSFPAINGPDLTHNGGSYGNDAFIAKVNTVGTGLVYCGYIGGTGDDAGNDIAVDSTGNAYISGDTLSDHATFPVTVGPDLIHNGASDAFVAKVNTGGTALTYCGYIGGASAESGWGIAIDTAGNAYVTGNTNSNEGTFPVVTGPDISHNGVNDVFVAKVNAAGTALAYCGYIGGSFEDWGYSISVDSSGNAYVTGSTASNESTFPETVGPYLKYYAEFDAFIAKVNAAGSGLSYCGYIGGSKQDSGGGITVDNAGNAYVTGSTQSNDWTFPAIIGPAIFHNGGHDAFVAKVNSAGTRLSYCGYIGGSGTDGGSDIAVDGSGNAYIIGSTTSDETTFPVITGPDGTHNGDYDAFVAKIQEEYGRGVFRPSAWENWILDRSADGITDFRDHFGSATDKPLIADFNNDGTADRALFRSGEWILDYGIDGTIDGRPRYGMGGDIPLAGYMDGYLLTSVAVFRNGQWIFDYGFDGFTDARDNFGTTGDIPLIGDFNNDGIPDRAVFRASAWENWIIDYNMDRSVDIRDHYGGAGDIPVVGDFNRDGITDRAVFRAGEWIIDYSMDRSVNSRPRYGQTGDCPLVWLV